MSNDSAAPGTDAFDCVRSLPGGDGEPSAYFSLPAAEANGAGPISRLPLATACLVEGLLRHQHHAAVTPDLIRSVAEGCTGVTVPFFPRRILLQDASGIPVLADLVTLRERALADHLDPAKLSPILPMDLVVDHALEVDRFGDSSAATFNLEREYHRHDSRYRFLRWAATQLPTLRVIPPGVGICHQLNLEVLASLVAISATDCGPVVGLDSVVGTDSHTTMINGLAIPGWGVGGIEATAAALGEPLMIALPRVVGVHLHGRLQAGSFASDLALTLARVLRELDVVGAVVEFFGPGLAHLSVPDRATVANMAPEYGATMAFFPADEVTTGYLRSTGRHQAADLANRYLRAQGLHGQESASGALAHPTSHRGYQQVISIDLTEISGTVSGPSRPHQALALASVPSSRTGAGTCPDTPPKQGVRDGDVVIASITSCTNTSNPRSLVAAGLLARSAVRAGLRPPSWTKTSFTPGSRTATMLLTEAGLQSDLDALGFAVAGFGCGTCMGNSGPLAPLAHETMLRAGTVPRVAAVLSGNRNFTGRIHPDVIDSYLTSPALVVAYALLGNVREDLETATLGKHAATGEAVTLADLWPSEDEIEQVLAAHATQTMSEIPALPLTHDRWQSIKFPLGSSYDWESEAGNIRRPPFSDASLTRPAVTGDIHGGRPLMVLGDGVTTDHISPVARIQPASAAGRWLRERGVAPVDLGSFSSRRLNHEVMLRGGFANPHLQNALTPGLPGGFTTLGDGLRVPVHEAAARLSAEGRPIVVVAGEMYGAGSARDWAAKVTRLLGVQAILARGFERIHRTNLVAMGVVPVEWDPPADIAWDGTEEIDLLGLPPVEPGAQIEVVVRRGESDVVRMPARCRIDTAIELSWVRAGGVIPYLMAASSPVR